MGFFDCRWSCGVTKKILPGDRVFLIKLGADAPTGIMASGNVLSPPFEAQHYSDPNRTAWYTDLRFDVLLQPVKETLLIRQHLESVLPSVLWTPRASGVSIPGEAAAALESLWTDHLAALGLAPSRFANEVEAPERYWEGAVRQIAVDAYERDPRARKACLAHHGRACGICGFDFGNSYGELGRDFIHVHHLRPLGEIREEHRIDPAKDLIPVCPNCHAMLHMKSPPLSPAELRSILEASRR
jgi:5-methylcytosine-specific restriction protein A